MESTLVLMPKSAKLSLLAISVAMLVALFLGANWYGVHAATDDGQAQGAYKQINVYGEVLQHIENDYVVEPSIPKVTQGALRGLAEALDADSGYLSPADYATYKDQKPGKAQVGVTVSKRFGYATVVSVVPNSPADKANLQDGEIIEAVNGKDTRDIALPMIRRMMEGAPGTQLKLAILRPQSAKPDDITLNRVVVQEPALKQSVYENSTILYLKPSTLDHEQVSQIESKLKAAAKGSGQKVLLDLRDVSTGDMSEGVRLANLFLSSGVIAKLEGQTVPTQTFSAEASKAVDTKSPLVVLVNRGTAGAAELTAAALADNKRADLVGEHTFGEGVEQKTFPLPDGGALILSVAKYEAPDGKKFEDEGVTPGTQVAESTDSLFGDDTTTKAKTPVPDDQLNKALDMLKAKSA